MRRPTLFWTRTLDRWCRGSSSGASSSLRRSTRSARCSASSTHSGASPLSSSCSSTSRSPRRSRSSRASEALEPYRSKIDRDDLPLGRSSVAVDDSFATAVSAHDAYRRSDARPLDPDDLVAARRPVRIKRNLLTSHRRRCAAASAEDEEPYRHVARAFAREKEVIGARPPTRAEKSRREVRLVDPQRHASGRPVRDLDARASGPILLEYSDKARGCTAQVGAVATLEGQSADRSERVLRRRAALAGNSADRERLEHLVVLAAPRHQDRPVIHPAVDICAAAGWRGDEWPALVVKRLGRSDPKAAVAPVDDRPAPVDDPAAVRAPRGRVVVICGIAQKLRHGPAREVEDDKTEMLVTLGSQRDGEHHPRAVRRELRAQLIVGRDTSADRRRECGDRDLARARDCRVERYESERVDSAISDLELTAGGELERAPNDEGPIACQRPHPAR